MYCLSEFCCFCFRNKLKLRLVNKITYGDTPFLSIINNIIPEMQLFGISHVLSICDQCVKNVTELHAFRQTCIQNSFLLVDYIERLSVFGADFGKARIRVTDVAKIRIFLGENDRNDVTEGVKELGDIKEEPELPEEDPLGGFGDYDYDRTRFDCETTYQVAPIEELVEVKLEVNDFDVQQELTDNESSKTLPPESPESNETKTDQQPNTFETQFSNYVINNTEKLYKCRKCGKHFNQIQTFKNHNMAHHGEKRHKCEICAYSFSCKRHLRIHSRTHQIPVEKPYKCDTCGKCFSLEYYLTLHKEIRHK